MLSYRHLYRRKVVVSEGRKNYTSYRFVDGYKIIAFVSLFILPLVLSSCTALQGGDPVVEAKKAIADADPFMGDWQGSWKLDDGSDSGSLVAQVIALGNDEYRVIFFRAFDMRQEPIAVLEGRREGKKVRFAGPGRAGDTDFEAKAVIEGEKLTGTFEGQYESGSFILERVIRLSPTLGEKPPVDAIVLFDGTNFNHWKNTPSKKKPSYDSVQWKLLKGRAMEVKPRTCSIVTKKKFTDFKLHLEFRTPFMPEKRGQARGNSGVYLQGRYEVQILDSYTLECKDNECGGIYKVGPPLVNMCAPPMRWQTYDITFRAPRLDGEVKKDAVVTVVHNGVTIHDEIKIPKPTGGALDSNVTEPGGLYLQDHGNSVQFRNIWLVEL